MELPEQIAKLNEPQRDAVLHTEGPVLVLAGAGTGKTRVLTSRIIHIVNSYLASPLQILAVTFTNKAAAEMKHRIGEVIGEQVNNLWIGTFHSIAARIMRRHAELVGLKNDFTIIDQDDQLRLLKQILGDFNIDTKQFPAKNYLGKISRAKDLGKADDLAREDIGLPKLKEAYEIYQSRLKSMNAADFGDLLSYNLEIFEKAPEVLSYYQNKFRYILVDEYQDTNNVQYQWLLKLADLSKNICAVGDDDQSIYSWRGANIANILRFEKDFSNAKVIRLEENYRSSGNILRAADSVISNNKERHGKTLWTKAGQGEKVKLFSFLDDRVEAATITDIIQRYRQQRKYARLADIAILVRAGYQTRSFEEAFIRASLPYRIIGGMKFYERMEVKDAICYLRAAANRADDLALSRILNVPKRGVGESTIDIFYQKTKNDRISLYQAIRDALEKNELKGKAREGLKTLVDQLDRWNAQFEKSTLAEVTRQILMEAGYIQMWQSENSIEAQGRIENIDEFINSLGEFENVTQFLEYVSLVEAKEEKSGQDSVAVMTVHAAKGLEFELVFIPGLEDGIFPSARATEERKGEEEERRLLYVAITRARKELIMSYTQTRFVFGDYQQAAPSRFIKELPKEDIEDKTQSREAMFTTSSSYSSGNSYGQRSQGSYQAKPQFSSSGGGFKKSFASTPSENKAQTKSNSDFGKRVFHQKFGYGKVVAVDGNKLEIEFEKTGRKTVMKDFISMA